MVTLQPFRPSPCASRPCLHALLMCPSADQVSIARQESERAGKRGASDSGTFGMLKTIFMAAAAVVLLVILIVVYYDTRAVASEEMLAELCADETCHVDALPRSLCVLIRQVQKATATELFQHRCVWDKMSTIRYINT